MPILRGGWGRKNPFLHRSVHRPWKTRGLFRPLHSRDTIDGNRYATRHWNVLKIASRFIGRGAVVRKRGASKAAKLAVFRRKYKTRSTVRAVLKRSLGR
jgi:hypothetical protein